MVKFMHIGVPVKEEKAGESYAEGLKVHITDPDTHDFKYEYLRFEEGTPMPKVMQEQPHIAFMVDDMKPYLDNYEVIVEPFAVNETLSVAFIIRDSVIIELMAEG